jgi:Major Facilitator Superfamily
VGARACLGRLSLFVVGLAVFVAASAACAFATNVGWLIAARIVQGAGAALVMPLAMALLSASFPPDDRARALGLFGSITGLALIVGPVLGGAIAQGITWQWIFWLNVPVGLILIPLALQRIPESFGPGTEIDARGVLLVTGAALGLTWALTRGNSAGWSSSEVVVTLLAGILLTGCFIAWEGWVREPMVDQGARDRPRVQDPAGCRGLRAPQEGRRGQHGDLRRAAYLRAHGEADRRAHPGHDAGLRQRGRRRRHALPVHLPIAATDWSQGAAAVDLAKKQLGGTLKGRKIAYFFYDNRAGCGPIEVIDRQIQRGPPCLYRLPTRVLITYRAKPSWSSFVTRVASVRASRSLRTRRRS